MLYMPRGLWSAGIELRLAPGSLLSLGDLGATSTCQVKIGLWRGGGAKPDGSAPAPAARPPADDDGGSIIG